MSPKCCEASDNSSVDRSWKGREEIDAAEHNAVFGVHEMKHFEMARNFGETEAFRIEDPSAHASRKKRRVKKSMLSLFYAVVVHVRISLCLVLSTALWDGRNIRTFI